MALRLASRFTVPFLVLTLFIFACLGAASGCGSPGGATFPGDGGHDGTTGDTGRLPNLEAGDQDQLSLGDGGGGGDLTISPKNPVLNVTLTDGVIAGNTVTLTAKRDGATVSASWSLDEGQLGAIVATGKFTASGNLGGTGTVTAQVGSLSATTMVTVNLSVNENGPPMGYKAGDAGLGGVGGVGGSGLGGVVPPATVTILNGKPTPPTAASDGGPPSDLSWLYPYDGTIWPQGLLAPLLQWQTSLSVDAVYIHLSESGFDFKGYYSGTALVNQPIEAKAWEQATYGNRGDPLKVEIVVDAGGVAYGPITENWTVAPGVLQGTVYYNSYNSQLAGLNVGAVLSIQPGATSPSVAVPGTETTCHVCHEVSANGSTLIMEEASYSVGDSYDLAKAAALIANYSGSATDGTSNDEKFVWAGMYPDATFAMANSRHAREHYDGDSLLFRVADGNSIATTGWTSLVTSAVTPSFSGDGSRLAFNFWEGTGTTAIPPGAGHTLVTMDFACGTDDAGTGCGAPPYAFSNMKQLYNDPARYPGWPAWTPDGTALAFHNTVTAGSPPDNELATWQGAQAELWFTNAPPSSSKTAPSPIRMDELNGNKGAGSYLPKNANHPNDTILNYEPTMNPIASGGYYWVVFTTRRMYGNVATGAPYDGGDGSYPVTKKLWVAAIDMHPTPGKDPSHPAFYLPGQELNAGNLRGFWVVNPCKVNGTSCLTGDECCNGFCRTADDGGGLMCTNKPKGCAKEYEKCTMASDCCGVKSGFECVGGFCVAPSPP
jgi:hypothetical protein